MRNPKITLLLALAALFAVPLFAQTPPLAFSYQALVRDGAGQPVRNQAVGVRISLILDSSTAGAVYEERHTPTTNNFGNINLAIGRGTLVSGSTSNLDLTRPLYINVAMDIAGGTTYTDLGTTQALSVPYAMYAQRSGSAPGDADADPANEIQILTIKNDTLQLSLNGGEVKLPPTTIADGSITTSKLADASVTTAKVADNAVTSVKIANSAVTNVHLAADAVGTSQIANGAITSAKISDNAVTTSKIADNAVGTAKLSDLAVTTSKLADASVTAAKLAAGAADDADANPTNEIQLLTITNDTLHLNRNGGDIKLPPTTVADGSITTAKLADDAVGNSKLMNLAVTDTKLANNAVTTGKLADSAVNFTKLSTNAVTFAKLANDAVGTTKLMYHAVTTEKIDDYAVGSTQIADGAITNSKLLNLAVTTSKLADGSVTAAKLATGLSVTQIQDADGNTRVSTERSPNENIIRFDLNGVEKMRLTGNRLEFDNIPGGSIHIGDSAGAGSIGSLNLFIGSKAGRVNTFASVNTFVGHSAGFSNTSGDQNTFVGGSAGYNNTTGYWNTFTGVNAGNSNTTGYFNTFVGNGVGYSNTTGYGNVYIGRNANQANDTNKLLIGNGISNLIWGDFAADSVRIWGGMSVVRSISATAFNVSSDRRLKENIQSVANALEGVGKIHGVYYTYKAKAPDGNPYPMGRQIGVIAQDVEKVYPELVATQPGGYKAVDYPKLTAVLIEAVKELKQQNAELLAWKEKVDAALRLSQVERDGAKVAKR